MKTEHYWESRPAEMSGPGSRGGGDRVKACSHPRGAEWRHWACPLVSNNLPPPRYLLGQKWLPAAPGWFPPEYSLCWAALPGLQVAGQQARGLSRSPRQTLGNPEGPLSSSQGSHGSRAAGWRATLPRLWPPRWQASLGHLPFLPCPYTFYRVSSGSNGAQNTRNQM